MYVKKKQLKEEPECVFYQTQKKISQYAVIHNHNERERREFKLLSLPLDLPQQLRLSLRPRSKSVYLFPDLGEKVSQLTWNQHLGAKPILLQVWVLAGASGWQLGRGNTLGCAWGWVNLLGGRRLDGDSASQNSLGHIFFLSACFSILILFILVFIICREGRK